MGTDQIVHRNPGLTALQTQLLQDHDTRPRTESASSLESAH